MDRQRRRTSGGNNPPEAAAFDGPPAPEQDPEPDHEAVARKILLDQLTGQARSRHELAERLARRNVPEEIAQGLLDRFTEVGLIDDEAFARSWVDSRRRTRGLARPALAQELRRKGIDEDTRRTVLDEVDPGDEEESARALVRKKMRSMRNVDEAVAARRLAGMLARKGYGPGVAFGVVRQELRSADLDD